MQEPKPACCRYKHTPRSEEAKKKLINRLNRMIGQLGGIKKMIEEDRYCLDVLNQILAAQKILEKAQKSILSAHLECCVKEAFSEGGGKEKIEEIVELIGKF